MRPFIVDDNIRQQFADLVAFAEANPISIDDQLDNLNNQVAPPGDREGYSLSIPFGFRIVMTIDEHPKGRVRHISVSVPEMGKLPSPAVVEEIMKLTGFKGQMKQCQISLEQITKGHEAVNIYELCSTPQS